MNSGRDVVTNASEPAAKPLASWYTPGVSDGLGDRLLMFDNTAASSLELLRFRPALVSVPGFEAAVRDRVAQLALFQHTAFARVHAVKYLEGDEGLALVSTHTPGKRLSDMFQRPEGRGALHPAFAVWMIRQLTPALAALHSQGTGVAHGALSPERIVLTSSGRLVIVEHVLGAALERLQWSAARLWSDLGLIAPSPVKGHPRVDVRADVVQLGLVALSILLGRRVTPEEYPQRLALLLDEFTQTAERRAPRLVPQLRLWLQLALQTDGGGFASALDAHDGLHDLAEHIGPQTPESPESREPRALAAFSEADMKDPAYASPASVPSQPSPAQPDESAGGVVLNYPAPDAWSHPPNVERIENPSAVRLKVATPRMASVNARHIALVVAVVAIVEAAIIGRLLMRPAPPPPAPAPTLVTIESGAAGDGVMLDGRQVGVTPLAVNVDSAALHAIRVVPRDPGNVGVTVVTPSPADLVDESAKTDAQNARTLALAAAKQRSGGLKITSPIDINVIEGDRVLGSSADGPIVTSAGVHQLDFVNTPFGYRARQTVEIKAGQFVSLSVQPPDGRLSINASPWAQVLVDGNPVGETPLANLAVPVGQHEITFRHPQLGERRETAIVKAGALTRVSATLGR
jgi:PEGA domain-containing protein